jgi:hypothetical protein
MYLSDFALDQFCQLHNRQAAVPFPQVQGTAGKERPYKYFYGQGDA